MSSLAWASFLIPTCVEVCFFLCLTNVVRLLFFSLVYQKLGYIEVVGRAAELSMCAVVEEVQALPEYVSAKYCHYFVSSLANFSGLLLMHGMIPLRMPSIQQYHACPEGMCENFCHVLFRSMLYEHFSVQYIPIRS